MRLAAWDQPRSKKPLVWRGIVWNVAACWSLPGVLPGMWCRQEERTDRELRIPSGLAPGIPPHAGRPRHARTAYLGTPHCRLNYTAAPRLHSAQSCRTGGATVVFFNKQNEKPMSRQESHGSNLNCDMADFWVI